MDVEIITQILGDKHFVEYPKMKHKYKENFDIFLNEFSSLLYEPLPLYDFKGSNLVFICNKTKVSQKAIKLLLQSQKKTYGTLAAENEIIATSAIENIDFSRESVRNILKGLAPTDEQENRIWGMKKGLDFIADTNNKITEENLYKLYMMTVGDFLEGDDALLPGNYYRHDKVFVVSDKLEHLGLNHEHIPKAMQSLIEFANTEDETNDLIKAAIIHFYVAYVHPYFDGNGRIARLMHLWFLVQSGYKSALFIPFSSEIEKSRKAYYGASTAIETNYTYSGRIDVTPFIIYFANNVYNKLAESTTTTKAIAAFEDAVKNGKVTVKERDLWNFVLSTYGTNEFSTKQLEKDFGNAAYATIRAFVLKFEVLELLTSTHYGARVKYKIQQ